MPDLLARTGTHHPGNCFYLCKDPENGGLHFLQPISGFALNVRMERLSQNVVGNSITKVVNLLRQSMLHQVSETLRTQAKLKTSKFCVLSVGSAAQLDLGWELQLHPLPC